jgi:altronate hydrolase
MNRRRNLADYAIILSDIDNVATALVDLPAENYISNSGESQATITVPDDISAGFKLALSDIRKAEPVYKYGYVIGLAKTDIKKGHCVHVHNLVSSV